MANAPGTTTVGYGDHPTDVPLLRVSTRAQPRQPSRLWDRTSALSPSSTRISLLDLSCIEARGRGAGLQGRAWAPKPLHHTSSLPALLRAPLFAPAVSHPEPEGGARAATPLHVPVKSPTTGLVGTSVPPPSLPHSKPGTGPLPKRPLSRPMRQATSTPCQRRQGRAAASLHGRSAGCS